jgi:hypothetical protein
MILAYTFGKSTITPAEAGAVHPALQEIFRTGSGVKVVKCFFAEAAQ